MEKMMTWRMTTSLTRSTTLMMRDNTRDTGPREALTKIGVPREEGETIVMMKTGLMLPLSMVLLIHHH